MTGGALSSFLGYGGAIPPSYEFAMPLYAADGAALSVEALIDKMGGGWPAEFLTFWGHHAKARNKMGKHVLSQWWPAAFTLDGVRYPTAEHYMMAQKADLFGDAEMLGRIRAAETPGDAKGLGRKVRGFDQALWDASAFDIVIAGSIAKFGQNAALKSYLLGTAEKVLVEASPLDRVWGIGLAEGDLRCGNPLQWEGRNLLGFALMAARAAIAGEAGTSGKGRSASA